MALYQGDLEKIAFISQTIQKSIQFQNVRVSDLVVEVSHYGWFHDLVSCIVIAMLTVMVIFSKHARPGGVRQAHSVRKRRVRIVKRHILQHSSGTSPSIPALVIAAHFCFTQIFLDAHQVTEAQIGIDSSLSSLQAQCRRLLRPIEGEASKVGSFKQMSQRFKLNAALFGW